MGWHKPGRRWEQGMPSSGQAADSGAVQETRSPLGSHPSASA